MRVQRWRFFLLLAALATVLAGWPLEQKVAELREPRNQAIDAYLQARGTASGKALEEMQTARKEFGTWHLASLLLNFATVLLVTGGMVLAAQLPQRQEPDAPARTS